MGDKWSRHIGSDFNRAADPEQPTLPARASSGSDQVRNTENSLAKGPPPPKGPGMAIARQRHQEAMAADHRKATGQIDRAVPSSPHRKAPEKGDLKRDFDRSR